MLRRWMYWVIAATLVTTSLVLFVNMGDPFAYDPERDGVFQVTVVAQMREDAQADDVLPSGESAVMHREIRGSQMASRGGNLIRQIPEVLPIDITYAPREVTNLTAEQLELTLAGTRLEGLGEAFVAIEGNYGVNAAFAVGVAAYESGWGGSRAGANNLFGLRGGSGWMSFDSEEACVDYFGRLISESYAGRYTLEAINQKYVGGDRWVGNVTKVMEKVFNKCD